MTFRRCFLSLTAASGLNKWKHKIILFSLQFQSMATNLVHWILFNNYMHLIFSYIVYAIWRYFKKLYSVAVAFITNIILVYYNDKYNTH